MAAAAAATTRRVPRPRLKNVDTFPVLSHSTTAEQQPTSPVACRTRTDSCHAGVCCLYPVRGCASCLKVPGGGHFRKVSRACTLRVCYYYPPLHLPSTPSYLSYRWQAAGIPLLHPLPSPAHPAGFLDRVKEQIFPRRKLDQARTTAHRSQLHFASIDIK